ncbi:MAG: ABC transporter permease, partial [Pseudomonadota bacterium]
MKRRLRIGPMIITIAAMLYFFVPLCAAFEFSLQMKRGELSFAAYGSVFQDGVFVNALTFSILASAAAILFGALLV